MDAMKCILTRASVRRFSKKEIGDDVLRGLIEAASSAPSAGNCQDWEFVVVRESERKRKISDCAFGQDFISEAPAVVIVCSDVRRLERYGERGRLLYSVQDTAAATENLLLAAWAMGIGSCWVGAFDESSLSMVLGLPEGVRPLAIVPIGYPAEEPAKPQRRPLRDCLHHERF